MCHVHHTMCTRPLWPPHFQNASIDYVGASYYRYVRSGKGSYDCWAGQLDHQLHKKHLLMMQGNLLT